MTGAVIYIAIAYFLSTREFASFLLNGKGGMAKDGKGNRNQCANQYACICGASASDFVGRSALRGRPRGRRVDEVPVIGHEAIGENGNGGSVVGFGEDSLEGGVVFGLEKEGSPGAATVEDVVDESAGSMTGFAWHARKSAELRRFGVNDKSCPLFHPT
jgi:hypothetical protein